LGILKLCDFDVNVGSYVSWQAIQTEHVIIQQNN